MTQIDSGITEPEHVQLVIDKIAALPSIGKLVLSDKSTVESVRLAYEALSEEEKMWVSNIGLLEAVEDRIQELEQGKTDEAFVFDDVTANDWYYDTVKYVYDKEIMTGTSEKIFAPGRSLPRAQFASVLHRMEGEPEVEFEPVFSDVEDGIWYTAPILWYNKICIISITGVQNGKNNETNSSTEFVYDTAFLNHIL